MTDFKKPITFTMVDPGFRPDGIPRSVIFLDNGGLESGNIELYSVEFDWLKRAIELKMAEDAALASLDAGKSTVQPAPTNGNGTSAQLPEIEIEPPAELGKGTFVADELAEILALNAKIKSQDPNWMGVYRQSQIEKFTKICADFNRRLAELELPVARPTSAIAEIRRAAARKGDELDQVSAVMNDWTENPDYDNRQGLAFVLFDEIVNMRNRVCELERIVKTKRGI